MFILFLIQSATFSQWRSFKERNRFDGRINYPSYFFISHFLVEYCSVGFDWLQNFVHCVSFVCFFFSFVILAKFHWKRCFLFLGEICVNWKLLFINAVSSTKWIFTQQQQKLRTFRCTLQGILKLSARVDFRWKISSFYKDRLCQTFASISSSLHRIASIQISCNCIPCCLYIFIVCCTTHETLGWNWRIQWNLIWIV